MSSPVVSIVVPSHGGAHRLPELMMALREQQGPSWEAIVVLDGDVDNSAATLDNVASGLPVRRVVFDANNGRSAALNAGFEAARGQILVRCDDDLVPGSDFVARHADAHAGAELGAVGLYRNVYPPTAYARAYGRDWDEKFRREAYATASDLAWRHWAGNASVTRETWRRVGPYDTSFRAYGWEDVDWGYRLAQLGVPVVLDRTLETEHRIAATTTQTRARRAFYSGAAKRHFEQKHGLVEPPSTSEAWWDRLVEGVAARLDERGATRLGGAVDRTIRVLPVPVSRKAVALAVEAAARAGYARGRTSGMI